MPADFTPQDKERLEEIAEALGDYNGGWRPEDEVNADAVFLRKLSNQLGTGGGDDRLAEAESILRECDSPDGFCGEMPDELRDRIQVFLGRAATCPDCQRLVPVVANGRLGQHQQERASGDPARCLGSGARVPIPSPSATPVQKRVGERPGLTEFEEAIWGEYGKAFYTKLADSDGYPEWLIGAALACHDLSSKAKRGRAETQEGDRSLPTRRKEGEAAARAYREALAEEQGPGGDR